MTPGGASFGRIIREIRAGDPAGTESLHAQFGTGLGLLLERSVGRTRALELVREVLQASAVAILDGAPHDPMSLPGLVRAIARQFLDRALAGPSQTQQPLSEPERWEPSPRSARVAGAILHSMPQKSREALCRLYLDKQPPGQICSDLNLSPEQFQTARSEARQEFAVESQRKQTAPAPLLRIRAAQQLR